MALDTIDLYVLLCFLGSMEVQPYDGLALFGMLLAYWCIQIVGPLVVSHASKQIAAMILDSQELLWMYWYCGKNLCIDWHLHIHWECCKVFIELGDSHVRSFGWYRLKFLQQTPFWHWHRMYIVCGRQWGLHPYATIHWGIGLCICVTHVTRDLCMPRHRDRRQYHI